MSKKFCIFAFTCIFLFSFSGCASQHIKTDENETAYAVTGQTLVASNREFSVLLLTK